MANSSFDIVSEIDQQELVNALDQTRKEIATRYDFKDIAVEIKHDDGKLILMTPDEFKYKALMEIIQSKIIRRGLSLKILGEHKQEKASGGNLRTTIQLVGGIDQDKAKKISKIIRETMPKIKIQIQGDTIRVVSSSKDELQAIMTLIKDNPVVGIPLQFINYR
jgi:uncharacterized protein YajQ (UPF0234 family)